MVSARRSASTGPTFAVQSTHSSSVGGDPAAHASGTRPLLVSIVPLPLRSTQFARSAATLVTVPCIPKPRLAMYASPLPSMPTRLGMLHGPLWQQTPGHSPAISPTRYRPSSVAVLASHLLSVL